MARYLDEASAAADGILLTHEPERDRFVLTRDGAQIGEAHYSLLGDDAIDFDHTVVDPSLRGTGLAGVLAQRALTDPVTTGRRIEASCWFIAGYLQRHPELAGGAAADAATGSED
ncbi:GNAT family N-acetyltransferase [Leucobacter iarius]|uniref:N-acetyltransferase domain-containing protein n=1 Tax=Leucobacter iarius TaxID=333963 RepID=A0ABP4XPX6_9MICO